MKRETHYTCRVCGTVWLTEQEAATCQARHKPLREEWAFCDICGAGWKVGHLNPNWADNHARECEAEHYKKGDVEEVAIQTFWFSNGQRGKYFEPKCKG